MSKKQKLIKISEEILENETKIIVLGDKETTGASFAYAMITFRKEEPDVPPLQLAQEHFIDAPISEEILENGTKIIVLGDKETTGASFAYAMITFGKEEPDETPEELAQEHSTDVL
jgi:hypothetical protein